MASSQMRSMINDFHINQGIVIFSTPSKWSSLLNFNSPITSLEIKYPYFCTIKQIKNSYDGEGNYYTAMTDGEFGWSLDELVIENKILSLKEYRKLKLQKIVNLKK